jgi:MoxR-like ATPase
MRVSIGYPDPNAECSVIDSNLRGESAGKLTPVLSLAEVRDMIATTRTVEVVPSLHRYIVEIARATRDHEAIELGASPRAGVALAVAARSLAATGGRAFATADDIKAVAPQVLAHRLVLRPEAQRRGGTADRVVADALESVPVPRAIMR